MLLLLILPLTSLYNRPPIIDALRQLTHELLYLGMDGEPIFADRFRQLNSDVYNQAETLYRKKARNDEEEG